jgi:hypothetical protein
MTTPTLAERGGLVKVRPGAGFELSAAVRETRAPLFTAGPMGTLVTGVCTNSKMLG